MTAEKYKEDSVKRQKKESEDAFKSGAELIKRYTEFSEAEVKALEAIGIKSTETMVKGSIEAIQASISLKQESLKQVTSPEEYRKIEAQIKAEQAKLKEITGITEKEAQAIRDKETEAIRNAEDAVIAVLKEGAEKKAKLINAEADRGIEDLKKSLKHEEGLTVKARESINQQIKDIDRKRFSDLQKLSEESIQKEFDNQKKLTEARIAATKSGSEQEFQLKTKLLQQQRDSELLNTELTEQMKIAIRAKYDKQMGDLVIKRDAELYAKQRDAAKYNFEKQIVDSYNDDQKVLEIKVAQKKYELETIQQTEGESLEAFNLRKIEIEQQYLAAKKASDENIVRSEQEKYEAMASITGALSQLAEAAGEQSKELAMASKVLALAEIAINTGKAIAAGIAQAQSVPFPGNIAAIATTVATVLSNIAIATKTVKSAKFATGGYVSGPGTESSDSIPAQLSNGESVINARSTDMFAPILSAMNMAGGGVPINVQSTSNQAIGEDMLARAVAKGVMMLPAPVVSVEEFTTVSNRVKYVENLGEL